VQITTTGSQNVSINGGLSAFHFFSSLRFPIRERLINEKGKHGACTGRTFLANFGGFYMLLAAISVIICCYVSSRLQLKYSQRK
jgi:hypothetical protein